ncbi:MAG: hypothetical protein EZS28_036650 [Streblomastix strix]|uniref:Uncharacterized protein n=1 Tax=Streblomastix strix TaxID=222440 RepID=A0A5J4UCD0_9EUKA|nr:MAG: hypothetical protein EZS28_036650 [Streblomastix strix]
MSQCFQYECSDANVGFLSIRRDCYKLYFLLRNIQYGDEISSLSGDQQLPLTGTTLPLGIHARKYFFKL